MNKRKLTAIILSISMIFAVSINSNKIVQAKTTEEAQQEINSNKSKIDDLKDKQNDINSEKIKNYLLHKRKLMNIKLILIL